jgi:hypothetical protein
MRSDAEDEPSNAAKNKSKPSVATETADAVRLMIAYALTSSTRVNNVRAKSLTPARRGELHGGRCGVSSAENGRSERAGLIRGIGGGNHFELDGFLLVGGDIERFG